MTLLDKLKQDLEFAEITTAGLHSSRTMWPRAIKALIKAIEALGDYGNKHALAEIEKELEEKK